MILSEIGIQCNETNNLIHFINNYIFYSRYNNIGAYFILF